MPPQQKIRLLRAERYRLRLKRLGYVLSGLTGVVIAALVITTPVEGCASGTPCPAQSVQVAAVGLMVPEMPPRNRAREAAERAAAQRAAAASAGGPSTHFYSDRVGRD